MINLDLFLCTYYCPLEVILLSLGVHITVPGVHITVPLSTYYCPLEDELLSTGVQITVHRSSYYCLVEAFFLPEILPELVKLDYKK